MLGRRLLRANARPLGALDAGVGLRFLSDKKRWKRPARPVLHTTASGDKIPQIRGEPLYGVHSVLQALDCGHREVHGLYVREGRTDAAVPSKGLKGRDDEAIKKIAVLAQERNIPVHPTSKWSLNYVTGDKPHQGVVLDAAPLRLQEFEPQQLELAEHHGRAPVILALDELQDPQNLGAILRSAHFLGCNSILLSERNSAPLSPAASRASAGALEVLAAQGRLQRTRNLHQTLAISKEHGWRVLGACSGANAVVSHELQNAQPTILVMGNEHRGMRKGIRLCCDQIVKIPEQIQDEHSRVDSLNVSVASAILLYELLYH